MQFIESVNTPPRFRHSLGVMQVMGELTGVYGLDKDLAETTGILHDAAKDLPIAQQQQIIRDWGIETRYPCETDYNLFLHGPVGAAFVQQELGVSDPLVLAALTNHTYCGNGEYFDHPLCWCLRIADLIEPGRNWSKWPWLERGVVEVKNAVFDGRLEEAAYLETSLLIRWFTDLGMLVHPRMLSANEGLAAVLKARAPDWQPSQVGVQRNRE